MKKIFFLGVLTLCLSMTAMAGSNYSAVWNKRATYFNLGYMGQELSGEYITAASGKQSLMSDLGGSLSWGHTFYLHKKPIANMVKFGLDWTWLDLNAAQYKATGSMENAFYQVDAAMQLGPSITINPVGRLKLSGYARITPTYSAFWMDNTLAHGYATFYNYGATIAWRMLSFGVELRNGLKDKAEYKLIDIEESLEGSLDDIDDLDDLEGNLGLPSLSTTGKSNFWNSHTIRFFIGFRF